MALLRSKRAVFLQDSNHNPRYHYTSVRKAQTQILRGLTLAVFLMITPWLGCGGFLGGGGGSNPDTSTADAGGAAPAAISANPSSAPPGVVVTLTISDFNPSTDAILFGGTSAKIIDSRVGSSANNSSGPPPMIVQQRMHTFFGPNYQGDLSTRNLFVPQGPAHGNTQGPSQPMMVTVVVPQLAAGETDITVQHNNEESAPTSFKILDANAAFDSGADNSPAGSTGSTGTTGGTSPSPHGTPVPGI